MDRYVAAVKLLFDPENAQVDLLSLQVKVSGVLTGAWWEVTWLLVRNLVHVYLDRSFVTSPTPTSPRITE